MKNLFKINILTYLFFLLSILAGYYKNIIVIYTILIIHELGHFIIMKLYKIKVYKINIYPYGGMIKSNILINTNSKKQMFISLGGILAQLLLLIIIRLLYNFNILNYYIYNLFIKYNLYIIIFNLIPIYPLDGYKFLNSIIEIFLPYKKSIIFSFIINIISMIIFLLFLYKNKINNYLIISFMITSLINYIKEIKYIINKFYIERVIYNLDLRGIKSIDKLNNLYKNKLNYINGINEKKVLKKKFNIS